MRGKMKVGVLLSVMLLPLLAGPTLASDGGESTAARPNTGINTDCHFPSGVNPICGVRVTVYGSKPENFYLGTRNPWGAPKVEEDPNNPGYWTLTFGDPVKGPCFDRNSDIFKECGVFKGLHFGFYTDDPVVNLLNPNSSIWSQVGPPCVYFANGQEIPCTGLTSHSVPAGHRHVQVINASANLSAAARASDVVSAGSRALRIQNVRIAVSAEQVAINRLGPCDLQDLAWAPMQLADNLLPASTDEGAGTLDVTIPDHVLKQQGWAVMVYDVTSTESDEILTTSTLTFPLGGE